MAILPVFSTDRQDRKLGECGQCHEGSPPSTHTAAYVERTHGPAALADPASCRDCHDAPQCEACHAKVQPEWHRPNVRAPARDPLARDEHVRVAAAHRTACAACHASRFRTECAACHRPDEDWMSSGQVRE